jgi:hypothetical protein
MPRPPKAKPKKEEPAVQQPEKNAEELQIEKSVEFIFDKTRDIGLCQPYHLDGDPAMYTKENLEKRNALQKDPDIQKELSNVVFCLTSVGRSVQVFSRWELELQGILCGA